MLRHLFKTLNKSMNCSTIFSKINLRKPLSTDCLFEKIKNGSLFGYLQCDLIVQDKLQPTFSKFPPKLKILTSAVTMLENT